MDQVNLGAWIDRTDTATGGVSEQSAALVHAVLGDSADPAPTSGDPLPLLWHWYGFPPTAGMDELGEDGHPRLGDFMPPVRLKRRMWAGGSLDFIKPLHVGEVLTRRTRIVDIAEKTGSAGDIVLLSLDHELHGEQGLAVQERQNIVYLEIPDTYQAPKAVAPPPASSTSIDVALSTKLLFRYSAITFNAHRVHYDLPYTQEVEHYPDLIVHGPLQANLLIQKAESQRGHAPSSFTYRGMHPLFAGDQMTLQMEQKSDADWALCTVANGTHRCMQANAIWEI